MSSSNGVIRIGRKGRKEFAFGDEGTPGSELFEVDVVSTFHAWLSICDTFRQEEEDEEGNHPIAPENKEAYHQAGVDFVEGLRCSEEAKKVAGYKPVSVGEALDFFARLRESYDDIADFFLARSREERASPATSEGGSTELRFSHEQIPEPKQEDQPTA